MVKKVTGLMLSWAEIKGIAAPVLRGTAIGSVLGILPGGGAMLSSFAAYALEKKVSKNAANFGKGAIEGVAAPESANNAGAQSSFIPMLTLGIPSNPVMALMIGAMIIHGIQPGPTVMTEQPELFWGVIASMWMGNLFLIILNLPLIGVWVRDGAGALSLPVPGHPGLLRHRRVQPVQCHPRHLSHGRVRLDRLRVPQARMRAGPHAARIHSRADDGGVAAPRAAPVEGRSGIFVTRPISATMLILAVLAMVVVLLPALQKKRQEAFTE